MSTAERGKNRRTARKHEAQARARRRRQQRVAVTAGLVIGAFAVVGGLVAWGLSSDGEGEASGQAIYAFDTTDFHSLAFSPEDVDTLYFGHHGGLKVSADGGESWTDGALQGVDVMQQSVPVDGSARHYAAGHEVFFVSTDGGATWNTPTNNLPALDIHGFAAAPSDSQRLYAYEIVSRSFYTSADGGTTWEARALPDGMQPGLLPLAVAHDDPLHVYAAVGEQMIESLDGGTTWQTFSGPGEAVISIATEGGGSDALLVGTSNGLWKGGTAGGWARLTLDADGSVLAVAVHPETTSRIAALDQQGNLYRSDDGGSTWEQG